MTARIVTSAPQQSRWPGTPTQPPPPGAKLVFLGDSITHGSTASAGQRFVDQVAKMLGGRISQNWIERGYPGQRSDEMLARYDMDVRANGAQVVMLMAGTNDAGQQDLSRYAAAIKGIAAKARQDGITLIIGTTPPLGGSRPAANHLRVAQFNAWLRIWAPTQGIKIADVYSALVSGGGYGMAGGYDTDGIHPETVGHQKIAEAFVKAFLELLTPDVPHIVDSVGGPFNMITNPQFLTNTTGWYEQPGGTGTAPTYSVVTDTSGTLRFGKWAQMAFDATASGGNRYFVYPVGTVTPGQKLLITARMQVVDIAGGYYNAAQGAGPTATVALRLHDQAFVSRANFGALIPRVPDFIQSIYTVPAGVTGLNLVMQVGLPTGQNVQARIGEVGVFDVSNLPDLVAAAAP
ncbi:SGNH/GDSL hydrolase family protein [Kineosporia succinea]|uniref:Lysophospholipase L1-like esterase n=1 Tax=Kineosporia succinea TaxID=84632 RepID=A0ABT9P9R1_9ACTN|nr:GDSL-type esterase/lipase family protein [Kineosporia succinea]MDP9829433.1 lysophospholipase L1-like esterase [Kineosporia succinea]